MLNRGKMIERKDVIEFKGRDVGVAGLDLQIGDQAQEFCATNQEWREINILQETARKVRIIASVPSLDTSVCDIETRRFNEAAASLGKDISIIVISMDLPFAQQRWCGAAGVDQVMVVSDHKIADFGKKYSTLLIEPRVLRRAVFIVDPHNVIRYAKYMESLKEQPDYDEVLAEAKRVLFVNIK